MRAGTRFQGLAVVQTAMMNDINPETYLRDTLAKIAEGHPISRIDELMPWSMVTRPGPP